MAECDTTARALAEVALRQQAVGQSAIAESLFKQAQSLNPDEVAAVLREHDAGHAADARDETTFVRDRPAQHDAASRQTGPSAGA